MAEAGTARGSQQHLATEGLPGDTKAAWGPKVPHGAGRFQQHPTVEPGSSWGSRAAPGSRPQPVAPALRSCPPPSRRVLQDSVSAVPGVHEDPPVQGRPAAAAGPGEGEGRPIPCARLRRVRSVPEGPPTCLGTAAARTRGSLATLGAWGCPPTLSPAAFPRVGSIRLWRSKSRRPVPPSDGGLGEPGGPHVAVSACGEVWLPSSWGAVLVVSDVG